ncbi:MAG: NAD(P)H-binding protein [Pseudonocardia sp.]|nr:NAD(P)H-binding protein [Pseudonocardia sp.]
MRVVIAGGHGKIALRLERLLTERGDQVVGVVRNPDHVTEVRATGAEAEVLDLEHTDVATLTARLTGADAVVFAAGAGPGSDAARKDTVDRAAAVLLADAAVAAGVPRYLMISSTGVDTPPTAGSGEVWAAYLRAKKAAEVEVAQRAVTLTVLRPGPLTDDPPADRVALGPPGLARAAVSRGDVAAVLVALLDEPAAAGLTLELMGGSSTVAEALAGALAR